LRAEDKISTREGHLVKSRGHCGNDASPSRDARLKEGL